MTDFGNVYGGAAQYSASTNVSLGVKSHSIEGVSQQRPWIRFFASGLNLVVYFTVIELLMTASATTLAVINPLLSLVALMLGILAILAVILGGYIPLNAYCLSTIGSTPGKWLLKTWVYNKSGEKLSFKQAAIRELRCLLKGHALGVPVVNIVTMFISYRDLNEHGETSWDAKGQHVVVHEAIGSKRAWCIVGGVIGVNIMLELTKIYLQGALHR
ncbi:MAG: RDD family protein [Vampirovibrionales bacterium]|nr:RDD family protein [Vampirovibrionales bacterium]